MRAKRATFVVFVIAICATSVAHAEWPLDWPFLRSDEGWFFYKEPPSFKPPPPTEAPTQELEPAPNELTDESTVVPIPPPTENVEGAVGSTQVEREPPPQASITLRLTAPNGASVAPLTGPALEAWLLELSDRDLQRIVIGANAAQLRMWIPILLDQALTTIDRRSVRKYLLAQQESLRRSEKFSKVWQEIVWTDPTFDRPGTLPTGALAQTIYEQDQAARRKHLLHLMRESVNLLLVVGPDCAACEAQWTILSRWSQATGFTVRPIARTLLTLADSTAALPYPQIISRLDVKELPSLYLVEPVSGYLRRLGSGLLSEDEIVTRILRLIPDQQPKGGLQHVTTPPQILPSPFPDRVEIRHEAVE